MILRVNKTPQYSGINVASEKVIHPVLNKIFVFPLTIEGLV